MLEQAPNFLFSTVHLLLSTNKDALKINRADAPNFLPPKHNIKYMYEAEVKK